MALKPVKRDKSSTQNKAQIFVEEYLRTLNATQAALACGYTKSYARQAGYKMYHTPEIKAEIDTALAQRAEQCKVDTQWVIEQAKALVLDPRVAAKDRVKALDLLGRYTGAWRGDNTQQTMTTIEVRLTD